MYSVTRRRVLQGLGALPFAVALDAATPQGAAAMPAGSVTNPTGSVNGQAASFTDAYTKLQGVTEPIPPNIAAQWQLMAMLSTNVGVCARVINGLQTYQANEGTLRIVTNGYIEYPSPAPWAPPAADLPLVLPVVDPPGGFTDTSDGVHRSLDVWWMKATAKGREGTSEQATDGTVTFTVLDDSDPDKRTEAAYDLLFGSDRITGQFVAPWCG